MFGTPLITVMTSRKAVWSVNLHFVLGRTHHQGDTVSSGPHFDHLNFKKSLRKQRVLFVVWSLYSFVGVKMGYEFWVFVSLRSSWSFGNYSWIRYSGRLSCTQLLLCVCRWYRHESLHKGAKLRAVVNLCNYDVTWIQSADCSSSWLACKLTNTWISAPAANSGNGPHCKNVNITGIWQQTNLTANT